MPLERSEAPPTRATDVLANERTLLAYVRTALAFIAFGFVIARFSLFAREFAVLVQGGTVTKGLSTTFGTTMAVFGIFVAMLGAWRYAITNAGLRRGEVISLSAMLAYGVSTFVAVIGAIVAIALLAYR
ncbi:MAG TPA: DUF202 domain-containing protein [Candidatus Cybelea sp.]|jgi:putative membrane protein|nr:DUF202 domain-containing protein [Candidatus Cybelea sp.]